MIIEPLKDNMKAWEKLQWYVAEKFQELGDKYARPTVGSGNANENGDVLTILPFTVECKQRNTKNITIKIDVWEKNKGDIPLDSDNRPLVFLENKNGKRFAVLEADDFFDILKENYVSRDN